MIETARRLQDVAVMLARVEPGVTVAGPALDGGLGLTTKHNGYTVHLGIGPFHCRHDDDSTILIANGKLYLDPKPPDDGRPLIDLVRAGLPSNCALASLPGQHVVSRDPFQREQLEWQVGIVVSGLGMGVSNLGQNSIFIIPKNSLVY